MLDSSMSVVLPIEKADEFMNLFYPNNMDGFNVEEKDERESYDNEHGLAFRCISFQPPTSLYDDIVLGLGTREMSLEAVCREYGVKRLTMYRLDGAYEESVTYDKKNGVKYQDRSAFPMPEDDGLGEEETLDENEAEAGQEKMQVKNKIIEQLDDTAKQYFYELLDDDVLICKAKDGIPDKGNVVMCGDGLIVSAPTSEQEPFCDGRVMPLYAYLPDMKDDAAYIAHLTEENALHFLDCMKEQYEPKEVYDYLMEGHKNGTLWNIMDAITINEFSDEENDRKIEIGEVYYKGEWKSYACTVMGINERHTCGVSYEEHNLKAALKHFSKYLKGPDKRAFDKFMQSEAEM